MDLKIVHESLLYILLVLYLYQTFPTFNSVIEEGIITYCAISLSFPGVLLINSICNSKMIN